MGDLEKQVKILFQGDDVGISKTIDKISRDLHGFGENIEDIGEPFVSATDKVMLLNVAIAGIALAGLNASADIEAQSEKMQASLGLPAEEAERFEEIAKKVYSSGFGDDLAGAFDAATVAQKKFGGETDESLQGIIEKSMAMQNIFDVDYAETMSGVSTLMTNFGMSSDEAFGFVTKGLQDGLNGSGDFIESINEYGTQFANGGATAQDFFNVMSSGYQEGMLGTDKAADAFKEFRVRIQDGSSATKEALESIGIDADAFDANLSSGKMSAIQAFDVVVGKLNETNDSSLQMQAGVGLLGTQFEDLGTEAALGLSTAGASVEDFNKSLESIKIDNFEKKVSSAWRTLTLSFGDLEIWDDAKDKIGTVFADIAEILPEAFDNADYSGIIEIFDEIWEKISTIFSDNDLDLTTMEGLSHAIEMAVGTIQSAMEISSGLIDVFAPFFSLAVQVIDKLNELDTETVKTVGQIMGVGVAVSGIGGIISGLGTAVGATNLMWGKLTTSLGVFAGPLGVGAAVIAAGALGLKIGDWLSEKLTNSSQGMQDLLEDVRAYATATGNEDLIDNFKELDDKTAAAVGQLSSLNQYLEGLPVETQTDIRAIFLQDGIDAAIEALEKLPDEQETTVYANAEMVDLVTLGNAMDGLPEEKRVQIQALMDAGQFKTAMGMLDKIPKEKAIEVGVETDRAATKVDEFAGIMTQTLEDGSVVIVQTKVNQPALKKTTDKVETDLTPLKILEIETKLDVAKLEATTKMFGDMTSVINTQIEWDAKFDIAQVEADAEKVKAAFESIGGSVVSVTSAVSSMFSSISGAGSYEFMKLFPILEKEQELQEKLINSQIKLTDAQAERIESGEPIGIRVESSALAPALEMIFQEIMTMTQTTANAEGLALLGVKG